MVICFNFVHFIFLGIDGDMVKRFIPNWFVRYGAGYSIFMFIMWAMLLLGINEMIVAFSVSIWFFNKQKSSVKVIIQFFIYLLIISYQCYVQLEMFLDTI